MRNEEVGVALRAHGQRQTQQAIRDTERDVDRLHRTAAEGARRSGRAADHWSRRLVRTRDRFRTLGRTASRSLMGIGRTLDSAGDRINRFAATAAKRLAAVGAVFLGTALFKGGQRLLGIDDARGKLRGLGHDAQSVATIMDSALASVKGTAFGLADAATIAASAVAAGIKPGEELTDYLKLTADAATIAGTSLGDMGSIFGKVTTSGRAMTENLNQLADRGIPIFQWLQEEYGVTGDALRDMVTAGAVDAKTFRKVIEENIGGAALESGRTFRGALANVGAAIGRFGARVLEPFMDHTKSLFADAIDGLDDLTDRVGPYADRIAEWSRRAFRSARAYLSSTVIPLFRRVGDVIADRVVPAVQTLTDWYHRNHEQIHQVVGAMVPAAAGLAAVAAGVNLLTGAWGLLRAATPAGLIFAIGTALVYAYQHSETFRDTVTGAFDTVRATVDDTLLPAFQGIGAWWDEHGDGIITQLKSLVGDLSGLMATLRSDVLGVRDSFDDLGTSGATVAGVIEGLVGAVGFLIRSLDAGLQVHFDFSTGVDSAWTSVMDSFRTAVNFVIRGINTVTGFLAPDGRYGQIPELQLSTSVGKGPASPIQRNTGGKVPWTPGARAGVDSVDASLTPNEWVINAAVSSRHGDAAMRALNEGRARIVGGEEGALRADPNAMGGTGYAVGRSAPLPARLVDQSTIKTMWDYFQGTGARFGNGYREGSTTYHGKGQAIDITGDYDRIYKAARGVWGRLKEYIAPAPLWKLGGRTVKPFPGRLYDTHVAANRHAHIASTPGSWGSSGGGDVDGGGFFNPLGRLADALTPLRGMFEQQLASQGAVGRILAGASTMLIDRVAERFTGAGPQGMRDGGRVLPGFPIEVGEAGRERWIPDGPGTIVPNDELDGGGWTGATTVNYYLDGWTVEASDPEVLFDKVKRVAKHKAARA